MQSFGKYFLLKVFGVELLIPLLMGCVYIGHVERSYFVDLSLYNNELVRFFLSKEFIVFFSILAGLSLAKIFLLRGNLFRFLGVVGATIFWVLTCESLVVWINALGTDSFVELRRFDAIEAIAYVGSLREVLKLHYAIETIIFFVVAGVFLAFQEVARRRILRTRPKVCYSLVLLIIPLVVVFGPVLKSFYLNSDVFEKVNRNFTEDSTVYHRGLYKNRMQVILYIGESTTIMNMGVYGYPRNTTPNLDRLVRSGEMLRFNNVLSTHTHTTPSLLQSLSVPRDREYGADIYTRKRLSLVDYLSRYGVRSYLVSNQGQSGSWNLASSIIFGNAERKYFSNESILLGNRDTVIEKPYDDIFLVGGLERVLSQLDRTQASFIVLHSYAGHAPYHQNIPSQFQKNVDTYYKNRDSTAIFGNLPVDASLVEAYDSAIQYIDYSLSKTIVKIAEMNEPAVFVYFSDHGESVFSGRFHDSSRFVHEMIRVPFMVFFNQKARELYPNLYKEYVGRASYRNVSTLDQFSATLSELFGIESDLIRSISPIGVNSEFPPIVIRQEGQRRSFVGSAVASSQSNSDFVNKSDSTTQIYIEKLKKESAAIYCYHRANTFGKAFRGVLAANCLEADLVITDNGELNIYHPPMSRTSFALQDLVGIVKKTGAHLWIDGKNLDSIQNCWALYRYLKEALPSGLGMVEFPSQVSYENRRQRSCIEKIKEQGFATSYYVPTDKAVACSQESGSFSEECEKFRRSIRHVVGSGVFSDLSFDFRGLVAIRNITEARTLSWNTWGVQAGQSTAKELSEFSRVIFNTEDDPNSR